MVNSKKLSKKLIALVAMAFLLIASIALGVTGAWLTDTAYVNVDDLTFGTVSLGEEELTITCPSKILPGASFSIADATYTGNVDAYYAIIIKPELGEVSYYGDAKLTTSLVYNVYYGEVTVGGTITFDDITLTTSDEDGYYDGHTEGDKGYIEVHLVVIQQQNLGDSAQTAFETATSISWWLTEDYVVIS